MVYMQIKPKIVTQVIGNSQSTTMYQTMTSICSSYKRASGPALDAGHVLDNPTVGQDCIGHITSVSRKQFSRYVSKMLDQLGYSYNMIKERQKMFEEFDKVHLQNSYNNLIHIVTTGGKGEGTSLRLESDCDFMLTTNNIVCTDRPHDFDHARNITIFQADMQNTSPGYTRMKLVRLNEDHADLLGASLILSNTDSLYLSSDFFKCLTMTSLRKAENNNVIFHGISGPSTPSSAGHYTVDSVKSFMCICDYILESWVSRPRYHGWPSPATIRVISRLDGHVVPVGFKGSENMGMEWRICYSLAELHLMRTFNELQLKVYVLLKKISKSVFNPVCTDMTSYIMKNVVLWVSEANGVERFTEDLLVDRLLDCIRYLRKCLREKTMPSYMIPERNLFAGRLDDQHRHRLTCLLNDLLDEGGKMILRCDRFREACVIMYVTPEMLREFAETRDKVESLILIKERIVTETSKPRMSNDETRQLLSQNEQFYDIDEHIRYLIKFNAQALRQNGKTKKQVEHSYEMRLFEILS